MAVGSLLDTIAAIPEEMPSESSDREMIRKSLPGANRIYKALRDIIDKQQLQGFTLRCFDLLNTVKNTGCLALAKLNSEGFVAGCEGDVPAMLSMKIIQSVTGLSGFQANPSAIDPETGEILFAHCTIPLNMVERYQFDTHYESGIGVGIRGYMKEGAVTVFKVSGDLSRSFIAEGTLSQASYFLTNPIGNHHIIVPGCWKSLLEEILK